MAKSGCRRPGPPTTLTQLGQTHGNPNAPWPPHAPALLQWPPPLPAPPRPRPSSNQLLPSPTVDALAILPQPPPLPTLPQPYPAVDAPPPRSPLPLNLAILQWPWLWRYSRVEGERGGGVSAVGTVAALIFFNE